jgi:hypothetical protein
MRKSSFRSADIELSALIGIGAHTYNQNLANLPSIFIEYQVPFQGFHHKITVVSHLVLHSSQQLHVPNCIDVISTVPNRYGVRINMFRYSSPSPSKADIELYPWLI